MTHMSSRWLQLLLIPGTQQNELIWEQSKYKRGEKSLKGQEVEETVFICFYHFLLHSVLVSMKSALLHVVVTQSKKPEDTVSEHTMSVKTRLRNKIQKKASHKQNSAKGNSEYLWLTNGNSVHSQEIMQIYIYIYLYIYMYIPSCKLTSMWKIHHLHIIFLVSTSLVYPRVAGPDHPPHHTKEQLGNLWKRGARSSSSFNQGFYGWLRVVHDGFACFLNQDNSGIIMGNIDGFILSSSVIKHGDIPELNGGFKWENHRSKSGGSSKPSLITVGSLSVSCPFSQELQQA